MTNRKRKEGRAIGVECGKCIWKGGSRKGMKEYRRRKWWDRRRPGRIT